MEQRKKQEKRPEKKLGRHSLHRDAEKSETMAAHVERLSIRARDEEWEQQGSSGGTE